MVSGPYRGELGSLLYFIRRKKIFEPPVFPSSLEVNRVFYNLGKV